MANMNLTAPASGSSSYLCDTLPAPRLASPGRSPSPAPIPTPPVTAFQAPILDEANATLITDSNPLDSLDSDVTGKGKGKEKEVKAVPARKLCVRHQRMADEGTNLKLQQVGSCSTSLFQLCDWVWRD